MRVMTHCGWGGTVNRIPMKAHHPLTGVEPKKRVWRLSRPWVLVEVASFSLPLRTTAYKTEIRKCPLRYPRKNLGVFFFATFLQLHRSSGVRQDWNCSSASVLPISLRACRNCAIVRSSSSTGKTCARRSASAKNSSIRLAAAQASIISCNSSLLSFSTFAARRSASSRRL